MSKSPDIQYFPVDVGYGYTKALRPGGGRFICPSLVSPAHNIRYKSSLADDDGITVAVNGSDYFVGDLAEKQGRGGAQTMSTDRVDGVEFVALFYAAASELVRIATDSVVVVTGLPVADYDDANKARLKKRLMGKHVITRTGRPARAFEVTQVGIVPQAVGCLYGMVLGPDGRVTQHRDLQQGRVAVIDVGQFTTNFVTLDGLEYVDHLSTSKETGVSRLLRDMQRDLRERHGLNLDKLSLVDKAVRQGFVEVRGKRVDIRNDIDHHATVLGDTVMAQAASLWGNAADITAVVLTGGGSHLLAEQVEKVYSQTRLAPQSQFSNVQGYLRLALVKRRKAGG